MPPGWRPRVCVWVSAVAAALIVCLARPVVVAADGGGVAPTVRVLVAGGASLTVAAPDGSRILDADGREIALVARGSEAVFEAVRGGVRVLAGGQATTVSQALLSPPATSSPGRLRLGTARYRGSLLVTAGPDVSLMAVNVIPLEEYLYGLVPCEMPPGWPAEALKAQAVAARSYAVSCCLAAAARGDPYDVPLNSGGQVYGGVDREDPRSNAAVDATAGQILTYSGEPVSAVFHSSSGGHTENSEFVWSAPVPYLRGVEDPADDSPYRSWELRATREDIERALNEAGSGVGRLLGITGVERGVSGRWSRLAVKGSSGEVTLRGTDLRRIVGLRSTLFTVTGEAGSMREVVSYLDGGQAWAISASGDVRQTGPGVVNHGGAVVSCRHVAAGFLFRGSGYGHGAGLSQWGAHGMANQGIGYEDILRHYYMDTRLEEYWDTPEAQPVSPAKGGLS